MWHNLNIRSLNLSKIRDFSNFRLNYDGDYQKPWICFRQFAAFITKWHHQQQMVQVAFLFPPDEVSS